MHHSNTPTYEQKLADNLAYWRGKFEPEYTKQMARHVMSILDEVYFRTEFVGFDEQIMRNNPEHPVILCSNHSGMAFPWDAMCFGEGLYRLMGDDYTRACRALTAPMLSETALMNPYGIEDVWHRAGGVDATFFNFDTMMNQQETNMLVYPEGVPGIGKGWNRKYQLQRFATSIIRMSLKYKTDIQPFATVNGEYINPYCYSFEGINRFANKLGIPFLPIGLLLLLLPLQPWLFYFAFPAKLVFVRGKRISPWQWTDKDYEDLTNEEVEAMRDRLQAQMQAELDAGVEQYGKEPYQWGEHFRLVWKHLDKFPIYLPWAWAFIFFEFQRQWDAGKRGDDIRISFGFFGFLSMVIRNPLGICYLIPIVGWIPILINGYRYRRRRK